VKDLIALLLQHGVLLVFLVTLAARAGAPFPAAPLLVVAGGLSAGGLLSSSGTVLASLLANLAGDALWFWGGQRFGHRVMRLLCRISLSPDSCVRQSESLITRWGGASLVAAKFVPGISVVAAPMAGALHMSWRRFLAYDVLAGLLWTGLFFGIGRVFSSQIEQILGVLANTGMYALGLLAVLLAAAVALRYWRRRRFLLNLDMPRISVEELLELMAQEQPPLIVDVRSAGSQAADRRRIPGAMRIALPDLAEHAPRLPRDRDIVLYCNCPNDVSAALGARTLSSHGHTRARPLIGGINAWEAAGADLAAHDDGDQAMVMAPS